MIIELLHCDASESNIKRIDEAATNMGLITRHNHSKSSVRILLLGPNISQVPTNSFADLPGVINVFRTAKPYKLASREFKLDDTTIQVGGVEIGGKKLAIMAGPCAVESLHQLDQTASIVKEYGASILRGGAFKPRTSPFGFQGLGVVGLSYLRQTGAKYGLPVVTEVTNPNQIEDMLKYTDIFQVGARNMQNFGLLYELSEIKQPVLLKRGFSNTITELLSAADYLLMHGNKNIILCERGIRTFEDSTRFTLDVAAIPVIKRMSHLPIIVDPSHAAGDHLLVPALAKAAIAAGADGLIVEVHINPAAALVDGPQSLSPSEFKAMIEDIGKIAELSGRSI